MLNCIRENMLQAENNLLVHVLEMLLHEGVSIMSLCFYDLGLKKKRKKNCLHFNTYHIHILGISYDRTEKTLFRC